MKRLQSKNDEVSTSSPACTNPNVICSQSELEEIFKEDYYLVIIADGHILNLSQSCPLVIYTKVDECSARIEISPHFLAKELYEFAVKERPGTLYGSFNPIKKVSGDYTIKKRSDGI